MTPEELQDFANAQGRGYLKHWKAVSMIMTLRQLPDIARDRARLRKWAANCLEMEGFTAQGVDAVTDKLAATSANQ